MPPQVVSRRRRLPSPAARQQGNVNYCREERIAGRKWGQENGRRLLEALSEEIKWESGVNPEQFPLLYVRVRIFAGR